MKEIKLSNCDEVTIVDDDIFDLVGHKLWHKSYWGYARRTEGPFRKTHVVNLHRLILNAPKGMDVDHINHDKLDNRRCNLRLATSGQNKCNCFKRKTNKTGFKGVSICSRTGRFRAYVSLNRKTRALGTFDTPQDAAIAYNMAAIQCYGEFALLNEVASRATEKIPATS